MKEKVSTLAVRAKLGDMLNRVDLRHDEFIIERRGRPLAAMVPIQKLEQMERFARRHARELLATRREGGLEKAEANALARQAVRWARLKHRK